MKLRITQLSGGDGVWRH